MNGPPGPDVPVYVISVAAELTSVGIGLEGVRRILRLELQVDALQRRVAELEQDAAAADYALHHTLTSQQNSNLPAVRPPGGRSVTVWRRGRG